MHQAEAYFFQVGCQQRQRCQGCAADGKPFSGGGRSVADCIQFVSALAHIGGQPGHFCVAARIVGNGPVCVGRQGYTQSREHRDGS